MTDQIVQRAVLLHLPTSRTIDIEFENIRLNAPDRKNGKKRILNGVSGRFKSGELTAIMGPSGAGKTSLLNILTGFQTVDMSGTIKSSGSKQGKKGSKQYRKESCYILQDDQLSPYFTVYESMVIAADLKIGQSLSEKGKQLVIDDILDTLGLSLCKYTRCSGLSGGQKKRLSIALELVDNPPVMFLDEPTTGLDSSSSLQCVSMLKALARGGRTIVCTIHQPSATIYEMFDHVYVLAEGYCIYQGASSNTVSYLATNGLYCPRYHNPADFLLEVANGEYGHLTDQLAKSSDELNWRGTFAPAKLMAIDQEKTDLNKTLVLINPPSEWIKFWVLLNRSLLHLYRDWTVTHLKLLLHILTGMFTGLFYLNVGNDASKTVSNFGYFLVSLAYLCYTAMMPAVLKFPSELPVLRKERFNNWYALKTYYVAYMVADIPLQMAFCVAYVSISYFMSAQPHDWTRFLMFCGVLMAICVAAESLGLVLGTTVNPINGTFLGAIIIAIMLTSGGFLCLYTHMSKPFYIFSFTSYLRYGMQGLAQAVYGHGRSPIPCPEEATYCRYTSPQTFLKEVGMAEDNYWISIGVLCANVVILRIIAFFALKSRLSRG